MQITLGVIADTHVPDRRRRLDPRVLSVFGGAGVSAILHAGDVSSPAVLAQLGQVAPVHAVRGNRDWLLLPRLPLARLLTFAGAPILLTHGHGRWWNYFIDKAYYLIEGYRFERLQPRLMAAHPEARVVVFGHTHQPMNSMVAGRLLFNPGSPHFPFIDRDRKKYPPSLGLLRIQSGGEVEGEILYLE